MSAESLVDVERLGGDVGQRTGELGGSSLGGSPNPVDASTDAYQCDAHTPSVARGPAGHRSIASSNGDTEPSTDLDLMATRIPEEVVGVDHELAVLDQLDLLRDADVVEGDVSRTFA